jgi:hypothetical protein
VQPGRSRISILLARHCSVFASLALPTERPCPGTERRRPRYLDSSRTPPIPVNGTAALQRTTQRLSGEAQVRRSPPFFRRNAALTISCPAQVIGAGEDLDMRPPLSVRRSYRGGRPPSSSTSAQPSPCRLQRKQVKNRPLFHMNRVIDHPLGESKDSPGYNGNVAVDQIDGVSGNKCN